MFEIPQWLKDTCDECLRAKKDVRIDRLITGNFYDMCVYISSFGKLKYHYSTRERTGDVEFYKISYILS